MRFLGFWLGGGYFGIRGIRRGREVKLMVMNRRDSGRRGTDERESEGQRIYSLRFRQGGEVG